MAFECVTRHYLTNITKENLEPIRQTSQEHYFSCKGMLQDEGFIRVEPPSFLPANHCYRDPLPEDVNETGIPAPWDVTWQRPREPARFVVGTSGFHWMSESLASIMRRYLHGPHATQHTPTNYCGNSFRLWFSNLDRYDDGNRYIVNTYGPQGVYLNMPLYERIAYIVQHRVPTWL